MEFTLKRIWSRFSEEWLWNSVFFFWYFWRVSKELRETEANEVPMDAMWVWANFIQAQKDPLVYHSGSVEKLENVEMDRNL